MDTVICPRCGTTSPASAAFCGSCGTPLPAQTSEAPAGATPPAGWQPPASNQPPPPPPPPNAFTPPPPPPSGYIPPASGYAPPPPGAYPPMGPAAIVGNNTKWAVGLGIAGIFCCGPFTAIPGIFLAKKDMDDFAAGRAPQLNEGWAKAAFYLNIVALGLFVLGMCLFWGRLGMMRHL